MNTPRHFRLSTWLALLVAGIAVPLLAFAGAELWSVLDANERERDAALASRARAIASAVDAEIHSWRAVLHTLADTNDLRAGQFRDFDAHARTVAARHEGWIVAIEAGGQQRVNTLLPAGAPLPKTSAGRMVETVFQEGKPVTDFAFGAVAQRHIVSNAVPAFRDGRVAYCLAMNFGPERLTHLLEAQKLPRTWVSAIVDQRNLVVARSLDAEKRVGKPAPQALKEAVTGAEAGVVTYNLIDGRPARVAFQRLAEVPWVLVLAVPVSELTSSRPLVGFGWIAVLLCLVAVGAAGAVGRTIARPIRHLADLAPTLAHTEAATVDVGSRVQEVRQLQQALVEGAERVRASARERERAAEALRQAGAYNRSLIEASLDPLVTIGSDGRITDVNRATEEATGRTRAELIGTDFSDYFAAPDQARAGYQQVFRDGLVRDYPLEIRHRDGHTVPVLYNAAVYRDEAGNVAGVFAAARDVTELKRAEAALQEANEALEGRVAERTEALRKSTERFKLLSDVAGRLLAAEDPQALVDELCGQVMAHLDCQAFFNFTADPPSGRLRLAAYAGIPTEERQKLQWLDYGVAVCGCAAKDGCRIVAEDILHTPDPRTALVKSYGIQAYACHPLMVGERVIGTLSFGTTTRTRFAPDELALMKTVADQVAMAMERIRAARELTEAQQRLQAVMEAVPVGVSFSDDATCRRITGNPAVLAQFEVGATDNLSASAPDAGAPGRQVRFFQDGRQIHDTELALQRAVAENRVIPPMELEVVLPSGRRWFADASGAPVRDQQGNVIGGVAVTVDITARKRAEQRLAARNAVTESLAEAATFEVAAPRIVRDLGDHLGWLSGELWIVEPAADRLRLLSFWQRGEAGLEELEALLRSREFARDEGLAGRAWAAGEPIWIADIAVLPTLPCTAIALKRGLHSGLAFPIREGADVLGVGVFLTADLRPPDRELLVTVSVIGSQIGQFIRRRRAEAAVRESEAQLRAMFEVASVGFVQADPRDGRLLRVNDRYCQITGFTAEELLTRHFPDLTHPDDRARDWELFSRAARGETPDYRNEKRYLRKDGSAIWVHLNAAFVRDAAGQPIRTVAVCEDITDRKEAEERIRASLREKEVLLKEIHHRVKNNLQVISSLVRLQADALADPSLRELFRDVQDRVRSMALVHEKLYESADLAQVQFADYARSLLAYLWRAHGTAAAGIRLALELEPLPLSVETAVPCGLILNELAGNALKHAFAGRTEGEVVVTLRAGPDGRGRLAVRDDGVGLPPGMDWRTTHSLGLQLVQMLAGQLGGTLELRSGAGTVFEVAFPLPAAGGP